jgi:predicted PurR-regulated permease PerM
MLIEMLWGVDWGYGVPMILGSIAFHVTGLVGIEYVLQNLDRRRTKPRTILIFLLMILFTAITALVMHVIEATAWALLYRHIGAMPDFQNAMLYSLNALTSYGHASLWLDDDWRLLGAIESMNGVMIFGLTTAYLFNAMREFRPVRDVK